jgi:hypothetical protein
MDSFGNEELGIIHYIMQLKRYLKESDYMEKLFGYFN